MQNSKLLIEFIRESSKQTNVISEVIRTFPSKKHSINTKLDNSMSASGKNSEMIPFDYSKWSSEIAAIESKGSYTAVNRDSFALGKYQFVPSWWWKKIKAFAKTQGINLSGEPKKGKRLPEYKKFLDNPKLQDDWMRHYTESYVVPESQKLRQNFPKQTARLSDGKLRALIHFQGHKGAALWLSQGIMQGRNINIINPSGYMSRIT